MEVPSWVPDWSFTDIWPYNYSRGTQSTLHGKVSRVSSAKVTLTRNPSEIAFRGVLIDSVDNVTLSVPAGAKDIRNWRASFLGPDNAARTMLQHIANGTQTLYGKDLWGAYIRTLVGGEVVPHSAVYGDPVAMYERLRLHFLSDRLVETAIAAGHLRNARRGEPHDHFPYGVADASEVRVFLSQIMNHVREWNFCTTTNGYMGLVPVLTEPGDAIYVLPGARAPFRLS